VVCRDAGTAPLSRRPACFLRENTVMSPSRLGIPSPAVLTGALVMQRVPPVGPTVTAGEVFARFAHEPALVALAVVDGETVVGVVLRRTLIEKYAGLYTRDLFGGKPITHLMDDKPLIVEVHTDLYDLSRTITTQDIQSMFEAFVLTENGRYAGIGTGYDLMRAITEHTEARLYELAHFDGLTGLPNRLLFLDRLQQAMAQSTREERLVAIMMLDLDRFKAVNDTLGHSMGDELLKQIANRLRAAVREGDTIARLGGDEFTVLLPGVRSIHDATRVGEKILGLFSEPFVMNSHEIFITPSLGLSLYPFTESIDELLVNADTAMYRAKEAGGNCYEFYSTDMRTTAPRRLLLESSLRRALERGEFIVHYQPQAELDSGRIVGAEALLRWQHPELGLVSPSEFLPVAEETGLILAIGEWVLERVCQQARVWRSQRVPPLRVAINLSARQFYQKDFAHRVITAIARNGLDPRQLELELTEGALMQNTAGTLAILGELHGLGVRLAVDDFGTGYSSLSYLKRFPIDTVKIDRSFVADIARDADDAAIVSAIVAMAHGLGIRTVAEGVETCDQVEFLRKRGCDEIQGYLLGRPMPPGELVRFLGQPPHCVRLAATRAQAAAAR
jgi:diguanylate cyclase (GGDEF)-like protein